jgi:hypothetical protein
MILSLIILITGIVAAVIGVILLYVSNKRYYSSDIEFAGSLCLIFSALMLFISLGMLIFCPIDCNKALNNFIIQKEYIENYEPTSEYDTAAIINKKIELNEWLYSAQYEKQHYPICSFYGDEILELEPIK